MTPSEVLLRAADLLEEAAKKDDCDLCPALAISRAAADDLPLAGRLRKQARELLVAGADISTEGGRKSPYLAIAVWYDEKLCGRTGPVDEVEADWRIGAPQAVEIMRRIGREAA